MADWPAQLVKVRAGQRGSGWAVGETGVLTALHVVRPHLQDPHDENTNPAGRVCNVETGGSAGANSFRCVVEWTDEAADLALLRVLEPKIAQWRARLVDEVTTILADAGTEPLDVSAVGFPDVMLNKEANRPDPDQPVGTLLPASGIPGRLVFDVSTAWPDDHPLWSGMSGAAVRDRVLDRVVGVVTQIARDRKDARRLYASSIPDPAVDESWTAALRHVGAEPLLEARNAQTARRFLTCYDPAGRPWRVSGVPQLADFGVRRAREDASEHPYFPFVDRPDTAVVTAALSAALTDPAAPRFLLLVGESAAGKSRLAAHAVITSAALADYQFIKPRPGRSLSDLPREFRSGRALLWLDNLHNYPLHEVNQQWAQEILANPRLIVVATILRESLAALVRSGYDMDIAQLLTDKNLVARVDVSATPSWETSGNATAQAALTRARESNASLGEYLAAYPMLRLRYQNASPLEKALFACVADWMRTGITMPMPLETSKQLWSEHYLAAPYDRQFEMSTDSDQDATFEHALSGAIDAALANTALLNRTRNGLQANEVTIAERGDTPIPVALWEAVADSAKHDGQQAFAVALGAALSQEYAVAEYLWAQLMAEHPSAAFNLGYLYETQGDYSKAAAAYQLAVDSGDTEHAPAAAYNLGLMLEGTGQEREAIEAYRACANSGHPQQSPRAALMLGGLFGRRGNVREAFDAFEFAMQSTDPETVHMALIGLALSYNTVGDVLGEMRVWLKAAKSDHPATTELAATKIEGMRIESPGLLELVRNTQSFAALPTSMTQVGLQRAERNEMAGAMSAFRVALASGVDPVDYVATATFNFGVHCAEQGDTAMALQAFQIVIDTRHIDMAPRAGLNQGVLLARRGDVVGAAEAYQVVIDSGHTEQAPRAAVNLGLLLAENGNRAGAQAAFQFAADSGDPEQAPRAESSLQQLRSGRWTPPRPKQRLLSTALTRLSPRRRHPDEPNG
jgi:tetratricopeptide (TPR) repeat protein